MCYIHLVTMESNIQVRLSPEMRGALREIHAQTGIKPSALVRIAVDEFLLRAKTEKKLDFELLVRESLAEYGNPPPDKRVKK